MSSIRLGLVGCNGYTGLEVARQIASHPSVQLVAATGRADAGRKLGHVHPSLLGRSAAADLNVESFHAPSLAHRCDVVMTCLPHGAAAATVKQLVDAGTRVIDFSADFRLADRDTYEAHYGGPHPWPQRLGVVPYGLPEFYAAKIATADLVANPGCYPTSALLPIVPLIAEGQIEPTDIIIDAKSGITGAGRSAKVATLYAELNEATSAYAVGTHRHRPEIEELTQRITGTSVRVIFTPHLIPMDRGMLATIYVRPVNTNAAGLRRTLQNRYADEPFVHVVDTPPSTKSIAGTNHVHISVDDSGDRAVIICVIDNLGKGASTAAIQNLNVMFALDPATGLSVEQASSLSRTLP